MAHSGRTNLGFLLAKATQRWNEELYKRFCAAGFPEVRPSYGAILVPLFEEDGLRMGELGKRAGLSKQTMTTMVRLLEKEDLIDLRADPEDARARRIFLSEKSKRFRSVAKAVLADLEAAAVDVEGKAALERTRAWLTHFIEF